MKCEPHPSGYRCPLCFPETAGDWFDSVPSADPGPTQHTCAEDSLICFACDEEAALHRFQYGGL